jgi:hypothetical protein
MRWLEISCLTILIASPSVLSVNARLPRPSVQRETQLADSGQEQSSTAQAQAVNSASPAIAEPAKPAIQTAVSSKSTTEIQNYGDDKKKKAPDSRWLMIQIGLQIFFTFVTTVATVYVAKYTYQLVKVTRDLHKATEAATTASVKSALAAEKSVEVAERALAAQRPFLNIEQTKLFNLDKPEVNLGGTIWRVFAKFEIRNRGSGIGMIKSLHADFRIWNRSTSIRLGNLQNILYGPPIVGPNSSTENLFAPIGSGNLVLTEADRQDFFAERTRLNLLGTLVYTDMAESVEYTINFSWCLTPPSEKIPDGVWFQHPDELNEETERKKTE